MKDDSNVKQYQRTLEDLPFDNYRVEADVITEAVEQELIKNPTLSGVFILEMNQVKGVISRRKFFEEMSKEYARDIYTQRPIKLLSNTINYQSLTVAVETEINEAVKLALSRGVETIYEPIIITKSGEYLGMLELSVLILSQAQMFSSFNEKLLAQEQELRDYATNIELEKQKVKEYAEQLETQQEELKSANKLLKHQTEELEAKQLQLIEQTEKVSKLNNRFSEVGLLLSKEGKNTFIALANSVQSIIDSNDKINDIGNSFQDKFKIVNQATDMITKISKRVENLSFQVSVMAANLPVDDGRGFSVNMIAEEIKKLSLQIAEANTGVNNIAKELRPEIKILVNTAEENKKVVKTLARNSEKTELALEKLGSLVEGGEEIE